MFSPRLFPCFIVHCGPLCMTGSRRRCCTARLDAVPPPLALYKGTGVVTWRSVEIIMGWEMRSTTSRLKRSRDRGTIELRDDFNPHGRIPASRFYRFFLDICYTH